jgi:molybdopterin-guanine dinucleotide biosynthesis protein A
MSAISAQSNHIPSDREEITGVILAGGKSSRYGTNKAFVEINGTRLIERVIRVMDSIFQRIILITNTPREYAYLELPMFGDLIGGLGPLGGIYTGLEALSDQAGFFVACDMPFLNPALIRHLIRVRDDFDAVVPRIDWKIEPLHALYAKRCLPLVKESISAGEYQAREFYQKIRLKYVEADEIRTFDPELRSFFNVNRPEELLHVTAPEG